MLADPPANQQLTTERRQPGEHARLVKYEPWPLPNPALIGHCAIAFAGGWTVHDIPVFRTAGGGLSAGVPSIPHLDRDGRVKLKPDGKRDYSALLGFETKAARERWQRLVLGALVDAGIGGAA